MSQPGTPFGGSGIDSLLLPMNGGGGDEFSQQQIDELCQIDDEPLFSATSSNVFDEIDFRLDTTAVSTPDFSGFGFGHRQTGSHSSNDTAYSTQPRSNSPLPYPLKLQQVSQPKHPQFQWQSQQQYVHHNRDQFQHRSLPSSRTNTSSLRVPPYSHQHHYTRIHPPHHRRSLSQGDADRIAALAQANTNPTFFRLQTPRARSSAPEDGISRGQGGPISHHHKGHRNAGRCASQAPGCDTHENGASSGMSMNTAGTGGYSAATSTPMTKVMSHQSSPTAAGTPLSDEYTIMDTSSIGTPIQLTGSSDPYFVRMSHPDQSDGSRRVIEIGALAVLNRPRLGGKIDPRLERERAATPIDDEQYQHAAMIKKLAEVETHIKHKLGNCEEELRACEMIREVLARKLKEESDEGVGESIRDVAPKKHSASLAPSSVFSETGTVLFDDEEGDLLQLLLKETRGEIGEV